MTNRTDRTSSDAHTQKSQKRTSSKPQQSQVGQKSTQTAHSSQSQKNTSQNQLESKSLSPIARLEIIVLFLVLTILPLILYWVDIFSAAVTVINILVVGFAAAGVMAIESRIYRGVLGSFIRGGAVLTTGTALFYHLVFGFDGWFSNPNLHWIVIAIALHLLFLIGGLYTSSRKVNPVPELGIMLVLYWFMVAVGSFAEWDFITAVAERHVVMLSGLSLVYVLVHKVSLTQHPALQDDEEGERNGWKYVVGVVLAGISTGLVWLAEDMEVIPFVHNSVLPPVLILSLAIVMFKEINARSQQFRHVGIGVLSLLTLIVLFIHAEMIHHSGVFISMAFIAWSIADRISVASKKVKKRLEYIFSGIYIFSLIVFIFQGISTWYKFDTSLTMNIAREALPMYESFIGGLLIIATWVLLNIHKSTIVSQVKEKESQETPLSWKLRLKRNWPYIVGVIAITLLAFGLRITNLTILDPYTDEYNHLVAAKELIEIGTTDYTRGMLVTQMARIFYSIGNADGFYEYVFWGRVPGVIFSSLTVIPLYFLAAKISRSVGLMSGFLWAVSPWGIGVGRAIREYAYYPFFVLSILLLTLWLIPRIFNKIFDWKTIGGSIVLVSFVIYAYAIDNLSTLKVSFLILLVTGAYYIVISYKNIWTFARSYQKSFFSLLLICIGGMGGVFLYLKNHPQVDITTLQPDFAWIQYVFFIQDASLMQWWYDIPYVSISYLLVLSGLLYGYIYSKKRYFLIFALTLTMLVFYVFLFDRYSRPRYIFYILPFISILVATSLVMWMRVVNIKYVRGVALISMVSLTTIIINPNNTLYPIISQEHEYVKTTNEFHDKVEPTILFLDSKIDEEDVFITTIMSHALYLEYDIPQDRIYTYDYKEKDRFHKVEEVITENKQGWMILDWRRNGYWVQGYPREDDFLIQDVYVEAVQNKEGLQIYRWNHDKNPSLIDKDVQEIDADEKRKKEENKS